MHLDVALLVGGIALLAVAAGRFIDGAARLAVALRLSPVVIGAVVIGFGTSAPELVVSAVATLQGQQDIAFGNVVGSNTANLLLIYGFAAVVATLPATFSSRRRELPLCVAGTLLLAAVTYGGNVELWEGGLLLLAGVGALVLILRGGRADALAPGGPTQVAREEREPTWRPALLAGVGLVGTLAGAQLTVAGAEGIALELGIPPAVVGLTVVAIGTSLPELVTAVAAARRRQPELVVGNVLGSNLFNSLLVAGVSGVLATADLDPRFAVATLVMLGATALGAFTLLTGRGVSRLQGCILLAAYAGALVLQT